MKRKKKVKKQIETATIRATLQNPKDRTLGISNSTSNALARPLKKAATDGILGKINYTFYEEQGSPARTFGAFCYTPPRGNRILFFPGIGKRILRWHESSEGFKDYSSPCDYLIDHFTLEKDFRSWHITILDKFGRKKVTIEDFQPREYKDRVFFWFALSVNNSSVLEITPSELNLSFKSPKTDAQRRKTNIEKAFENSVPTVLQLARNDMLDKNEYLHFEVYFTKDKREKIKKPPIENLPIKPTNLIYLDEQASNYYSEPYLVLLEEFPGSIFVIVYKFKGRLPQDAIITSPEFRIRNKYHLITAV